MKVKLNIGVCLNSDYDCHYIEFDDSWDETQILEHILAEGKKEMLDCCYKSETDVEELIRKSYNEYKKKREKIKQESTIFGQTKKIYEEQKRRLKSALKSNLPIPTHDRIAIESSLYLINEILREFDRREKEKLWKGGVKNSKTKLYKWKKIE